MVFYFFFDFEKAFDCLEWNFLLKTMDKMTFGSKFISNVKSLYSNNISSCVMNNGLSSQYFTVGRRVRQGDPLSPYLFILALKVLSCNIREETSIKGITVNGREIKIIQYADDTSCVLADEQSAKDLFKLINSFTEVSGLKLNVSSLMLHERTSNAECM